MYYGFSDYTTVHELQEMSASVIVKMLNAGFNPRPVLTFKGKIAKSFWGAKWCENIENYVDMPNRAARGRRYVRAGCVCDLKIDKNMIEAKVAGGYLYLVMLKIKPLSQKKWTYLCDKYSRNINSLVNVLQGKISQEMMKEMCNQQNGLFPRENEIEYYCSCPDDWGMCKHVTAVLYAIGRRMDTDPALMFSLRGVDPADLVKSGLDIPEPDDSLGNLGELFGIDLDLPESSKKEETPGAEAAAAVGREESPKVEVARKEGPKDEFAKIASIAVDAVAEMLKPPVEPPFDPQQPTGSGVRGLRNLAGLSQTELARELGVSGGSVSRWESSGILGLAPDSLSKLIDFQERLLHGQKNL